MTNPFSPLSWRDLLAQENRQGGALAYSREPADLQAVPNRSAATEEAAAIKKIRRLISIEEADARPAIALNDALLQCLSDAVVAFDDEFVVRIWNPAAERLYGWHADEVRGLSVDAVCKAHFPADGHLALVRAIRSGETWKGLMYQLNKEGDLLLLDGALMTQDLEYGAPGYVMIVRRAEAAENRSSTDDKWHQLYENLPEPIAITVDGVFVYVNQACASLHGAATKEALVGRSMLDFVLAPFHKVIEQRQQILKDGHPTELLEMPLRRLDGHVRFVRSYGAPVEYEGRRAAQIVIRDVTEEKRALVALERSERRFWALFERAGIGIIMATNDTRLLETNPAFQKMLGYTADELRNKKYEEITHPEDVSIQAQFYRQIHEGKIDRYRLEKRYLKKNGKIAWGSLTMAVIRDENGAVEYLIGMVEDISSRKKTEEELLAARSKVEEMTLLKSSFLTNVSHEIRTPLTGIIGFAAILEDELGEEERELVQLIQQSGHRLLQTLNAILDLSMLESGTMQFKAQQLHVIDEVLTQIHLLESKAEEKGLYLKLGYEAANISAYLDRDCLDRVLYNLISNAVKFTRDGGVTVSISTIGRDLVIKVADTGIGISEPFMPHLFEAFRQESTGMTRTFEGTGLGLTITQRMVAFLGGRIEVDSELGVGTLFTVTFPDVVLEEGRHDDVRYDAAEAPAALHRRPKVLVLEDNRDARRLLEKFLEGGYDVQLAREEKEALELARTELFDVVLMDINRGGGRTGVDALRALRHLSGYEQVPVVALTAYAVTGDRERFLAHGFNGYLGKPLTKQDLYDTIARVLDP